MTIAVLTAPLFEDLELWYPYYRLIEAGRQVELVAAEADRDHRGKQGTVARSTMAAADARSTSLGGVGIPGGYSPDHMRRSADMVDLVHELGVAGRPTAAICHGPWMLISAGLVDQRRLTSFSSIRDDLVNAGAEWLDEPVVATIDQIRDLVVDAANAHDAALVEDVEFRPPFPESLVDLFDRWPRVILARADLDGRPVAAVWLPDRRERSARVGHVEFLLDDEGVVVASILGGVHPDVVAREPPGRRIAEWESIIFAGSGEGDWA